MSPLELTINHLMRAFPGAQRVHVALSWPCVREALREARLESSPRLVAYALGTIAAESAGFLPLREMVSRWNSAVEPFDRYEQRGDLGNTEKGDGARFRGRGFIQLTGRANYRTYGERIAQPLVEQPELANEPAIAAQLLALFIADRAEPIESALKATAYGRARRLVNGGTHGLARFTHAYTTILRILLNARGK